MVALSGHVTRVQTQPPEKVQQRADPFTYARASLFYSCIQHDARSRDSLVHIPSTLTAENTIFFLILISVKFRSSTTTCYVRCSPRAFVARPRAGARRRRARRPQRRGRTVMCKFYDIEEESRDKYSNLSLSRCPAVSRMLRVSVPRDAPAADGRTSYARPPQGRANPRRAAMCGRRDSLPLRALWPVMTVRGEEECCSFTRKAARSFRSHSPH